MSGKVKLIEDTGVRLIELSHDGATVELSMDSEGDLGVCHVAEDGTQTDFSILSENLTEVALDWLGLQRKIK